MARFLVGLALGIALAFGYVRWNISAPGILELPEKLRGNIVATAVEGDLYDLDKPLATRQRALEVLFQNRAQFAAQVDAEFSHPFLNALYQRRVIREARLLTLQWDAFDTALSKPALRAMLEDKHGVTDTIALKQAMLHEAFREKTFLTQWLAMRETSVTPQTLRPLLKTLSVKH